MKKVLCVVSVVALLATPVMTMAGGSLSVSMGLSIRENGNPTGAAVGDPGTVTGGLEFVDRGGQQLILDGTWQQFTFDMATAPLTPFAGTSANGAWDVNEGIIDAIVIDSDLNFGKMKIWLDDLVEVVDPAGPPPPAPITLTDWEGWLDGDEVAFQEPEYSGSTAGTIVDGTSFSRVDNSVAYAGTGSYNVEWEWETTASSNWLRLTQHNVANDGNTTVDLQAGSIISFWAMGVPEPGTLSLLGFASLALLRRRR